MDYIPFIAREPTLLDKVWSAVTYPINLVSHPFDALLSIPALSIFIIPAFSSYGTTVNFLFFYLTWAILIRSNDPLKVELLGTLGIRVIFYILPSLGFLFFDSATPNLAIGIKEHGDRALPMGDAQGGRRGRWWKITLISILNVLLGVALQTAVETLFTQVLHVRSALKITTTPPFPWSIAKDLLFGLILREILTYVLHRYALHSPTSPLTKMHTSWQHSIISPFSFVAHYDHPLTYLVHVFLPTYIPAVFLRMHLLTYHLYLIIVSLEETFAYSGYNVLPFRLYPWWDSQATGASSHEQRGEATMGVLDLSILQWGRASVGDLIEDMVDEADKKQLGKRARGKAKAIGNKARKTIEDKDDDGDDDDDGDYEEGEEEEEEERPKRSNRSKNSNKKSKKAAEEDTGNDQEEEDEEEEEDPKPKRKSGSRAKKGKKSSDEGEEAKADSGEKVPALPKRKTSSAGRTSRKASGKKSE